MYGRSLEQTIIPRIYTIVLNHTPVTHLIYGQQCNIYAFIWSDSLMVKLSVILDQITFEASLQFFHSTRKEKANLLSSNFH